MASTDETRQNQLMEAKLGGIWRRKAHDKDARGDSKRPVATVNRFFAGGHLSDAEFNFPPGSSVPAVLGLSS